MALDFASGSISWNNEKFVYTMNDYDSNNPEIEDEEQIIIEWDIINRILCDLDIRDVMIKAQNCSDGTSISDEIFLIKSFCLSLMFARNYGFKTHLNLTTHKENWKLYESASRHPSSDIMLFVVETIIDEDDKEESSFFNEDYVFIDGQKHILSVMVDWQNVFNVLMSNSSSHNEEQRINGIMAKAIHTCYEQGLKEGYAI
jgi:hypothetical protein